MTERDPREELAGIARGARRYLERERAAGRGDLLAREGVIGERRVRESGAIVTNVAPAASTSNCSSWKLVRVASKLRTRPPTRARPWC